MNRPPLPTRLTIPIRCDDGDTLTALGFATRRTLTVTPSLVLDATDVVGQRPVLQRIDDRPTEGGVLRMADPIRHKRVDPQPQSTPRQRSGMGAVQCDRPHSRFTTRSEREGQASSCPQNETGTLSGLPNEDGASPQQSPFQGGGAKRRGMLRLRFQGGARRRRAGDVKRPHLTRR